MRIIADLHTHTIASTHAYSTIGEILDAARGKGLQAVAITDHGPSLEDAPHVWHFGVMRRSYPYMSDGVAILCGAEVNLYPGGKVDLSDGELSGLDFIICSQHGGAYPFYTDKKKVTADWLWACEHPYIDCLGHIGQNEYDFDHEAVVKKCAQTDTLIEINNASFSGRESVETFKSWLGYCNRHDCRVVVNSDAHSAFRVGAFGPALSMLDELQFPSDLVLNTDWVRLEAWVDTRRSKPLRERGMRE